MARHEGCLVIVEVKTRSSKDFGPPAAAVDGRKQRKLVRLAQAYLQRNRLSGVPVRFDVVSVWILPGQKPRIEVLPGAFWEH